jgi:dGTP triphosphohydrolase
MADINDICAEIVHDVDSGLACSVVDLTTGLILGVHHTIPYFTNSYLDAVAAAAVEMMRGKNIRAIEDMLASMRGTEKQTNLIEEVQMTTKGTYHFMAMIPEKPNALVVLITTKKANLGMGWAAIRKALPQLAPLCP